VITQNRTALNQLTAVLPDESKVIMSSLRQFSGTQPLYALANDGTLTNNQSGVKYRPERRGRFLSGDQRRRQLGQRKAQPGLHRDHRLG
jgi:maltose/maltodextrin transport system permease protein